MTGTESLIDKNLITIIITNLFTLFTIWLKEYWIKRKLSKTSLTPKDRSELFLKLTQTCGQIRNDLGANGVYIAYFHNGDYYKNGLSIDKFTVVAEDYDTKVKTSYTSKYQMINISYITYLYHRLLTDGRFYMDSILESDTVDSSYKDDLLKRKMSSTYAFLIKDGNEKPIGFISLEYSKPSEFKKEYESCIWKHQLSTSRNIKDITQK